MNPGDVVRLKSGGPPMTVVEVDGDWVTCMWFDDKNKQQTDSFQRVTLQKWVEPGSAFKKD
jgi:uncharacterized protein YodC (DUF2158 family)